MAPFETVVRTKIVPPQRRVGLLRRPRLVDFLHENLTKKLILISAAPGYGKTSLLLDFLDDTEVPTCWYAMDSSDVDPWSFVEHLAASVVRTFPELEEGPLATHPSDPGSREGPQTLLRVLVNEIQEKVPEYFALIVDDYHHADPSPDVANLVTWFLDHQPDNCCLILATRTMPALPFLRLTARQDIAGLGSEDLAFRADEIQAYLKENHNIALPDDEAARLMERTEGWITAILLGTHTLWKGLMRTLAEAEGEQEQIFEYLAQEVFEQQPEETQRFLRSTSILKVMEPDFCDALLGIENSDEILEDLEQANLFVTKLASPRGAYRYHGMFQEFLRSRFEPEAGDDRRDLHHKAGTLFEQHESWEEALEHYLAAGADDAAVDVLKRIMEPTFASGRLVTLARWLDALPTDRVRSDPELLVSRGRIHIERGELEEAGAALEEALTRYQARGDPQRVAEVRVKLAMVHRLRSDFDQARNVCEEVLLQSESTPLDPRTVGAAHRILGECHGLAGELQESKRAFRRSLSYYDEAGDEYYTALLLQNLGTASRWMGNHLEAEGHYSQALEILEGLGNRWRAAEIKNNMGVGHYYQGEYEQAQEILEEALHDARDAGHRRTEAAILASLGDVYRDLGTLREAHGSYQESLVGAREAGDDFLIAYSLCALADLYGLDQAWEQANGLLGEADQLSESVRSGYVRGLVALYTGVLFTEQGRVQDAMASLEKSERILDSAGAQRERAKALLWHGFALFQAGQKGEAYERLRAALALTDELAQPHLLVAEASRMPTFLEEARQSSQVGEKAVEALQLLVSQFTLGVARRPDAARAAAARPRLEIRAFGDGTVWVDGKKVRQGDWGGPLVKELFFFILERGPVRREVIQDVFWPELSPAKAKSVFHSSLYRMRRVLPRESITYQARDDSYAFNHDSEHWYEVGTFERLIQEARDGAGKKENLHQQAITLYRGEFLRDIYSDWCVQRRDLLRQAFMRLVEELAALDLSEGRPQDAINLYRRGIEEEPYREDLHRGLMNALVAAGRDTEAVQHYVEYTENLRDQLEVGPAAETEALFREISGKPPP